MSQLGRISGPLLADNLLRNGSDLAFETNLLYLNVNDKKIGFSTNGPTHDISVNGTAGTSHLIVDSEAYIANFELTGHQVQNVVGNIVISPNQSSNPVVTVPILQSSTLQFTSNVISNTGNNGSIYLNSAGGIKVNSNVLVNGNLHSTGNITFDGNLQLGNAATDTIDFQAEVNSSILPNTNDRFNLGSSTDIWNTVYVHDLTINRDVLLDVSTLDTLHVGNFTITASNITVPANNNINLIPTGTGVGNIESGGNVVKIIGNTWTPDPSTDVFKFSSTGEGIWDLSRSPVSFPVGDTSQRPTAPQVGMIRYNTEYNYEEVYNGTAWQPAIGPEGAIPQELVNDIMNIWSLILG